MKLRENADTGHEDPEYWYGAYGDHVVTEAAADICIQAIDPEWIVEHEDDAALIRDHVGDLPEQMTDDETAELVARARTVWDAACDMWACRVRVVDAYRHGDLALVVDRLEIAAREERKHGDNPATSALRKQLLVEDEETA